LTLRIVTSVDRAIDILAMVADEPRKVGALSSDLGIPRNTTYELIHTLVERRLLTIDPGGRVRLGVRLFELGSTYSASIDLLAAARKAAEALRDRSGETVHVAVLDGMDVIYLHKEESPQIVRMASSIGRRLPAYATGVGKVLLANLTDPELERRLQTAKLLPATGHTITDKRLLREELASVRAQGFATDDQESSLEVVCAAGPIRDRSGDVVAAMSVSAPISRCDPVRLKVLTTMVVDASREVSSQLGSTQ
jgi:DNA-binding IclR family transcriptional regulator